MRSLRSITLVAALAVLAIITLSTLSPIELRPHTGHVHLERVGAYLTLGALLAFTFPSRWPWALLGVGLVAVGLEWLQTLVPTRDGRLPDALEKAAGGFLGTSLGLVGATLEQLLAARSPDPRPPP